MSSAPLRHITGLYAAGNVGDGGRRRVPGGGTPIASSEVFGYLAGRHVAAARGIG